MFRYFYEGYKDRHVAVQGRLSDAGSDYVVVVADIAAFYPSVDKGNAINALKKRLNESGMPAADKAVIDFACRQVIAVDVPGLPIGPPLCHALANICLEETDKHLVKQFCENYFRYVDDIAVVTHKSDAESTLMVLGRILSDHGYTLNESKSDILTASDWDLLIDDEDEEASFSVLRQMLTEMATLNPQGLFELQGRLNEAGFNLPISHLLRISNGITWRGYFRNLIRLGRNKLNISPAYGRVRYIFEYAIKVREYYANNLSSKADFLYREGDKKSQARLRSLLRHVHCMMYMYNPRELGFLIPCLPDVKAAANTIAILRAGSQGRVDCLLPFSGKTTSAFSQLWSERMEGIDFDQMYSDMSPAEIHSLSVLGLSGVVDIHQDKISSDIENSLAGMLSFCSKSDITRRCRLDLDYIDEMLTLKIGTRNSNRSDIIKSRFDSREDFILEGLYVDQRSFS